MYLYRCLEQNDIQQHSWLVLGSLAVDTMTVLTLRLLREGQSSLCIGEQLRSKLHLEIHPYVALVNVHRISFRDVLRNSGS